MPFWSQPFDGDTTLKDPKRKFRFTVEFQGIGGNAQGGALLWYAKQCKKPSFTIQETEHKYLNHSFYYPSSLKWETIDITVVDPVDPDVAATVSDIVVQSGYAPPTDPNSLSTMSKAKGVGALGTVLITQIDANGEPLEKWTLWNAWIKQVQYGDLAYGDDELTELTITLIYDWARLDTTNDSSALAGGGKEFFKI